MDSNSDPSVMRNYFQLADKSNDHKLNQKEVNKFLASINLKLKPEELKKLIMVRSKKREIFQRF